MLDARLHEVLRRYDEVTKDLADPAVIADRQRFQSLAKERGRMEPLVAKAREYFEVARQVKDDEEAAAGQDAELRELAEAELPGLREHFARLTEEAKILLLPKDARDEKNAIVEIRAGTGGEEAALFASDLHRMYSR